MTTDPELSYSIRGHKSSILTLDFTSNGKQLVSGSSDGSVILWDLDPSIEKPLFFTLSGHSDIVHSVNCSPNGAFILSGSRDRTVRLWKTEDGRIKGDPLVYKCHRTTVRSVHTSPDSSQFCTASDDKSVKLWSAMYTNKYIGSFVGHSNWVRCAKFCPVDKNQIASCGDDAKICVFDVRNKQAVTTISSKIASHFNYIDWYPNHSSLFSVASQDGCIRIYDLRNQKLLQYYAVHTQSTNCLSFHPSGHYLLTASADETCKMFDLLEGRVLYTFRNHKGSVYGCGFTPDGRTLVTAGSDKTINVWETNLESCLTGSVIYEESTCPSQNAQSEDELVRIAVNKTTPKLTSVLLDETNQNIESLDDDTFVEDHISYHKPVNNDRRTIPKEGFPAASDTASDLARLIPTLVTQISALTDAMTSIEKRLSKVEKKVDKLTRRLDEYCNQ